MNRDEPETESPKVAVQDGRSVGGENAEQRKLSRLERLKKKLRQLQGKDPDIYPMW